MRHRAVLQVANEVAKEDFLPSRSTLYSLQPIGIGSWRAEALSSFTVRLANAHRVSTAHLLAFVLGTHAVELNRSGLRYLRLRDAVMDPAINGSRKASDQLVEHLMRLTGVAAVQTLSLSPLLELLSAPGIFRSHRAWCPTCLLEAKSMEAQIYEQALWSFEDAKACPEHGIRLLDVCSHCNRGSQKSLTPRSQPGHCAACNGFLGVAGSGFEQAGTWEIWKSYQLGETLRRLSLGHKPKSRALLLQHVRQAVVKLADGIGSRFAQSIGAPKNTVWMWLHERAVPNLAYLLRISWVSGWSLNDLLFNQCLPEHHETGSHRIPWKERVPRRRVDWEAIAAELKNLPLGENQTPMPLFQLARQMNFDPADLRHRFPRLRKRLIACHADHARTERERKAQRASSLVTAAVADLRRIGTLPTRRAVQRVLAAQGIGSWWGPELDASWKAALLKDS